MAKQTTVTKQTTREPQRAKKRAKRAWEEDNITGRSDNSNSLTEACSIQTMVDSLNDSRLSPEYRQTAASRVGQAVGNQHLQRVLLRNTILTTLRQEPGAVDHPVGPIAGASIWRKGNPQPAVSGSGTFQITDQAGVAHTLTVAGAKVYVKQGKK